MVLKSDIFLKNLSVNKLVRTLVALELLLGRPFHNKKVKSKNMLVVCFIYVSVLKLDVLSYLVS